MFNITRFFIPQSHFSPELFPMFTWLFLSGRIYFSQDPNRPAHIFDFPSSQFEFLKILIDYFFIMGRQAKKCPKKCTRHLFSLKPVHYSAFFSRESQFSYCSQNSKTYPVIPKFNRDGKPYTTAFILAMDQVLIVII